MRKALSLIVVLFAATLASSAAPPDRLPSLVAPAEARGLMMVGGSTPVVSSFSWEISQATWANTTGWTANNSGGTYTASGGNLASTQTGTAGIWNNTNLANAARQYGKLQFVTYTNAGGAYAPGFLIRYGGSWMSSPYQYIVGDNGTNVVVKDASGTGFTSASLSFANGNWMGVEVYGTGATTHVLVWKWTTNPGDWDAAHDKWGEPGANITVNSSFAANTGTLFGIGEDSGGNGNVYGAFYAGSASE